MEGNQGIDARHEHYTSSDHDSCFFPACTHPDCVTARLWTAADEAARTVGLDSDAHQRLIRYHEAKARVEALRFSDSEFDAGRDIKPDLQEAEAALAAIIKEIEDA